MLRYFRRPLIHRTTTLQQRLHLIHFAPFSKSCPKMSVPVPLPSKPSLRRLIQFYNLQGTDNRGRQLNQILDWSDDRLEMCHDYIQTLFPLPEDSLFADAPVIDEETYLYWRQHDELKRNMRRAFERMLAFYGLQVSWEQTEAGSNTEAHVSEDENARSNLARWVTRMDHNHLRITRIIRSLRVLGMEQEAQAFHQALSDICEKYGRVGATSRQFWRRALELPLYTAPDGTEVDWLEKYEVEA